MSSLQKFHRRTNSGAPVGPFTTIGSGSATIGFWVADSTTNKLVVAPKSTETTLSWGSVGTFRNVRNTTNGLANTNTLAAFGASAHPAAHYCKNLTTGGYNTWYMPAQSEMYTMYLNKSVTPFATTDGYGASGNYYLTSTEGNDSNNNCMWSQHMSNGSQYASDLKMDSRRVRAVRRSTI